MYRDVLKEVLFMSHVNKSDLTIFAKNCAYAHEKAVKLECISEEISKVGIARELMNDNQDILLEVSKQFAKYTKESMSIDLENGDVGNIQYILNSIINCCEENNWFE